MTNKDEEVLRQTGWDMVKEHLLSDAKSYPAWRRQLPNPISTKARYLITGDGEEANKNANRPRRDLDPLALDQDRRTLVEEQATWDYYNEEIKSIMYDSLVASSIAESYYDVDLAARANWKKFEKHFLPKGATRAQVSMELENLHTDNLGEGVDALAEAILSTHRRLLEIDPRYVLPNWLLNIKLIRLCRQRGMNTFADYCINSIPNLLNPTDDCLSFDVLRKNFVDSETQQQLAPQEAGGAALYSNAAFRVGIPNRQRGGSYQSLRGRGQSTVARGGGQVIMHPTEPSQAHRGTGNGSNVPDARKDTLGPVTSTHSYQTTKNLIGGINITVTRPMQPVPPLENATDTALAPHKGQSQRHGRDSGGNKIAAHLVKPEDEGDSDDNGVEPEVSLVQMEVGVTSDNLLTEIDDLFATEMSDKPPSSLELFMAQLAPEESDVGYVPAHLSRQNVEREPNSAYEHHDWVLDSGAGAHMCRSRDMFLAEEFNKPPSHIRNVIATNNERIPVKDFGTVCIDLSVNGNPHAVTLSNVLYVPDLAVNLLSITQLAINGYQTIFDDTKAYLCQKGDMQPSGNWGGAVMRATGTLVRNLYKLDCFTPTVISEDLRALHIGVDQNVPKANNK